MPLGGDTALELILNELRPGLPLKRSEIASRIGVVHHARGGRPMEKDKIIGVAKKGLKLLLDEGSVHQLGSGWYSIGTESDESQIENSLPLAAVPTLGRLPSTLEMGQINEAQTQRSVIEPVLSAFLGWDITDHTRVHVEKALETEISTNFVDYALDHDGDGKYEILIEAKRLDAPLSIVESTQLLRYMSLSRAELGILTNGKHWLFFDRVSEANSPIFDFDLEELRTDIELQKAFSMLSYSDWRLEKFIHWARLNSHRRAIASVINSEVFESPSDALLEFFIRQTRPNSAVSKQMLDRVRIDFKKVVLDRLSSKEDDPPLNGLDSGLDDPIDPT